MYNAVAAATSRTCRQGVLSESLQAVIVMRMVSGHSSKCWMCGTTPVSPGWLLLGITVGRCDAQTLKLRHYNVIPDLSGPTHTPWTSEVTRHHDFG